MPTREISRDHWPAFFDEFSRQRRGTLVSIEVVADAQSDPEDEGDRVALIGLSYDSKGSEAGSIDIFLGDSLDDHITHTITHPVHVYHKEGAGLISDEVNAEEILEITSHGGPAITVLRFYPAPPAD